MAGIRTSPFFNDPAFAQAAANLSDLFAPPSGADAAGWAAANAKNAEAKRLADFYGMSQDPNVNRETFDRTGIGAGAYNPTQSYYSVDQGNATARRGQDVTATTSRVNNAADNQRAIVTSRYGNPLNQGQVLPEMPGSVAGLFGLPAIPAAAGAPKPLSQDEVAAQRQQDLYSKGALTDQDYQDFFLGKETPVQAIGPDGKTPAYMSPGAAVRTGAQPVVKDGEPQVRNYVTPDGKGGSAIFDPTIDDWRDTSSKQQLPPGSRTYTGQLTGDASGTGFGKPTESSDRAGAFYNRAAVADSAMADLQQKGYVPNAKDFELMLGAPGDILPLSISNALVSEGGQRFYNQAMTFMMSVLRPDTGAAFGKKEFQDYARVFIPLPGDSAAAMADKAQARAVALAALQGNSRGAAASITQIMQRNGVEVPPEMLRHIQAAETGGAPAAPAPAPGGAPVAPAIPAGAINALRTDPSLKAAFDEKYGPGSADRVLGGG